MASKVKDFHDIPYLFLTEGVSDMGSTRKSTPEKLDKIIQFVWDYQDKHNGETPAINLIERQFNIAHQGGGYWVNLLVDAGRLNRISTRPFRATITEHKDNRKAIDRFKQIRARIEQAEAAERDRIRARQEEDRRTEDHNAVLEAMTIPEPAPTRTVDYEAERNNAAVPTPAIPLPAVVEQTHEGTRDTLEPHVEDTVEKFTRSRAETRDATRALKPAMPQLIKIAETRDLMFELIERGYHVSKG